MEHDEKIYKEIVLEKYILKRTDDKEIEIKFSSPIRILPGDSLTITVNFISE